MAKYVQTIESMRAIAIRSDQLVRFLKDGQKMKPRDRMRILEEDYKKTYEERLELYACDQAKEEFKAARAKHPDYGITEWTPAF